MTYEEANNLALKMLMDDLHRGDLCPQVYKAFVKEKTAHDCYNCAHRQSCSFQKLVDTMNKCNYFIDNSKITCHKVTPTSPYKYESENE